MNSKVALDLSCVNASTVGAAIGTTVSNNLVGQITTAFNTLAEQASQGQSNAGTKTSINPFDVLMTNASSSAVKQYNTSTTTNNSQTAVQSMIQNITANTFTTSLMNSLSASVATNMANQVYNIQSTGGSVTIVNTMANTSSLIASQVVQMQIGNTITTNLLNAFNIATTTSAETTSTQTSEAVSEAKTTSTGIAGLISAVLGEGGIAGIIEAPFQAIGSMFGGTGGYVSVGSCCSCCILIIIMVILGMMSSQ